MGMVVQQYEVFLVSLDPTLGREVQKTRPCVVLSPNEMNRTLGTTIIAPMTTKSHAFPTRIALRFQDKDGWIMLDQIRTVGADGQETRRPGGFYHYPNQAYPVADVG